MGVSRYPCRACGISTEGEDTYVICPSCLAELEPRWDGQAAAPEGPGAVPPEGWLPQPLAPDEIEARLRRLLDDW
jgi:hypothetical protein